MPMTPIRIHKPEGRERGHELHLPHIGLRKLKSILAIFMGFCIWQLLRLFLPQLETHPLFIYIYGLIEIRETSEKTKDFGTRRIIATFTAIGTGLPLMLLTDFLLPRLTQPWLRTGLQITVLLLGALLVLCVAEWVKCKAFCGLSAAIFIILMISHFETPVYLRSVMRSFQTIIGVGVAWVINVKLLPHPAKPGTFGYWLEQKLQKK